MNDFAISVSKWKGLTETEALDSEWDEIPTLTSYEDTLAFSEQLEHHRPQLERLVSRHLGIQPSAFTILDQHEWVWGSFNICLPIDIDIPSPRLPTQAILRIPLPFRSGEAFHPGNVDEKLRCEAATYVWLHRECPSLPVPRLLGMGFPHGPSFTAIENESFFNRILWYWRCCWAGLYGRKTSSFFVHDREQSLSDLGYLLIEYVVDGRPLSSSWQDGRNDPKRRLNLYHGLAKILLNLAKLPLPRIGSWIMDDHGLISLTNRPLLDLTMLWSRHEIPVPVSRNQTYTSAEPFIHDILTYHDSRLRHQRNSILSRRDGVDQLGAFTALRALLPRFYNQSTRNGPFVLTLPDLHQSNIIVDDSWRITGLIDFEFAPVQPVHMMRVPPWLNNQGIDQLTGSALDEYRVLYEEFVSVLEQQETASHESHTLSQQLRDDWTTGRLWYNSALRSSNAFPIIFEQHIQPQFYGSFDIDTDGVTLMRIWDERCEDFIATKLESKQRYEERIRSIFAAARSKKGKL